MFAEIRVLALMGLLLVCSWDAATAQDPTLGVFIRPDGIGNQTPGEVAGRLRSNGVEAVFYLTKLPMKEDEKALILDLEAALDPDIELHLWLTIYRNARYADEHPEESFVSNEQLPEEGWISPTSPRYRQDLLDEIGWLRSNIQPKGFLLDYFHVPFGPFDNDTMNEFCAHVGTNVTVANLIADADLLANYLEWRNEAILATLRAIREATEGKELFVFVLMMEESDRLLAGQDLAGFSGIADFLIPNTYHINYLRNAEWVGDGVGVLKAIGAKGVWPAIQAYDIEPREIRKAIRAAREGGADGVVLFRYGTMDEDHWEQVLRAYHTGVSPMLVISPAGLATILAGGVLWWRHRKGQSATKTTTRARRKQKHRRR